MLQLFTVDIPDYPRQLGAMVSERPWGSLWCQTVNNQTDAGLFSRHYLRIDPGKSISLHTHSLRREMFRVIAGTASALIDGERLKLKAGDDWTYPINPGVIHQLRNIGQKDLLIEEQAFGLYLHSDIRRLVDPHGRPLTGTDDPELLRNDGLC